MIAPTAEKIRKHPDYAAMMRQAETIRRDVRDDEDTVRRWLIRDWGEKYAPIVEVVVADQPPPATDEIDRWVAEKNPPEYVRRNIRSGSFNSLADRVEYWTRRHDIEMGFEYRKAHIACDWHRESNLKAAGLITVSGGDYAGKGRVVEAVPLTLAEAKDAHKKLLEIERDGSIPK
jgi:hypothetical protein